MFKDERSRKIVLVAHCILNQNSRASGLAEKPGVITETVEFLARNKIGIVQMPCLELAYAGVLRQPQAKEQYDNAVFRRHCRKIAGEIANQVQQYEEQGIRLKLVIGVGGSPSCSTEDHAIFIRELCLALSKRGISTPFYDVHYRSLKTDVMKLKSLIK
jgi:predicted secreted protein